MKTSKVALIGVLAVIPIVALGGPGESGHDHSSHGHSAPDQGVSNEHMHKNSHSSMHESMHGGDHGMHGGHGHHMESIAGSPGKESEVDRTIEVTANDSMKFIHEPLEIKDSETVKFVITNTGDTVHEFSIATKDEHMEHGKMMMKNPDMHHGPGGPSITIQPGETEELIWRFEEAWQVEVACNMPGHYEAGMHSPVTFK